MDIDLVKKLLHEATDIACLISVIDSNNKILYVNSEFCNITGYSKKELYLKDYLLLFFEDFSISKFKKIKYKIDNNKIFKGDIVKKCKDGKHCCIRSKIFKIENDKKNYYINIGFPINDIYNYNVRKKEILKILKKI